MKKILSCAITALCLTASQYSLAEGDMAVKNTDYMPSLITTTPLEGRKLAITIVRKTIGTIQTNADIKKNVRAIYEGDPMMLMRAAELVNLEFRIIAEANNYWRK